MRQHAAISKAVPTKVGALHVEVHGDGPAVLCWPSLYCDARTLDPVTLALDGFRVVVVDGPGHGRSVAADGPLTLDECADAAMEVLDALGIERAAWIGAAWGGHVGVMAARRHAERIAGLVILNAPMKHWQGSRLALMRLTYALLWLFGPRSFVAGIIADNMIAKDTASDRAELVEAVAGALRRCERRGLLRAARSAMFERGDLVPLLPEVRVPTIFFAGRDDHLFPADEARAQASKIPDCRFVVVERSSHQSALEAPDQILPLLRENLETWLVSHTPASASGSSSCSRADASARNLPRS